MHARASGCEKQHATLVIGLGAASSPRDELLVNGRIDRRERVTMRRVHAKKLTCRCDTKWRSVSFLLRDRECNFHSGVQSFAHLTFGARGR